MTQIVASSERTPPTGRSSASLATLALLFGQKFFPRLERLIPRLEYEAKVTLLWIAAIVGIYMVVHSVPMLRADVSALEYSAP